MAFPYGLGTTATPNLFRDAKWRGWSSGIQVLRTNLRRLEPCYRVEGELKNATFAKNDTLPTKAPALPAKYIEEGRNVAEKRIVLAGDRIAIDLNKK